MKTKIYLIIQEGQPLFAVSSKEKAEFDVSALQVNDVLCDLVYEIREISYYHKN